MWQSEHPFGQPSRMPSQSRGTPLVAYGSISRNGSIRWGREFLARIGTFAGPKKACILVMCRGNACVLMALENADANMRLASGRHRLRFYRLRHPIGLGPCAPRQRLQPHGPMGFLCSDTAKITICTLDSSVVMYISNMSDRLRYRRHYSSLPSDTRSQTTILRYKASPSYSIKTSLLLLVARRTALRRDERDTPIAAPGVASRTGRPRRRCSRHRRGERWRRF